MGLPRGTRHARQAARRLGKEDLVSITPVAPARARPRSRAALLVALLSAACDSVETTAPRQSRQLDALTAMSAQGKSARLPYRYLVTLQGSVSDAPGAARRLMSRAGGQVLYQYTSMPTFAAFVPPGALHSLRRNPQVARIEPDRLVRLSGGPKTPAKLPWGLDRIDQSSLPLDGRFSAPSNGAGATIYIIDSGIRASHREFSGRVGSGFSAVFDGNGTNDCMGHGTHVAGIAAGGSTGVAQAATVVPVRVFDCRGGGTISTVLAGLDWVMQRAVAPAVVNMSLVTDSASAALDSAVALAVGRGLTVVVAAGNWGQDACDYSPSGEASAITVGATDQYDWKVSNSNSGPCVDLYAPGYSIRSSWSTTDTSYNALIGTSMASPHVAGAAALYLAANPGATPSQVASNLASAATPGVVSGLGPYSLNRLLFVGSSTSVPGTDQPPIASFTASCSRGQLRCTFDGSSSQDDRGIVSYWWDFGDGTTPKVTGSPKITYTYPSPRTVTVTLVVKDGSGQTGTVQQSVVVGRQ
jgi:serine protease